MATKVHEEIKEAKEKGIDVADKTESKFKKIKKKDSPTHSADGKEYPKYDENKQYPDNTHACSKCMLVKPRESFVKDKSLKCGHRNICKACKNIDLRSKNKLKRTQSNNIKKSEAK